MTRDVGPNSSERRSPAPWRLSKLKIPLLPARRGAGAAGGGCRGMLSTTGPAKGMGLGSRSPSSSWHLAGLRSQNVPLESTGMGDLGWGIWDGGFAARDNGKRGWAPSIPLPSPSPGHLHRAGDCLGMEQSRREVQTARRLDQPHQTIPVPSPWRAGSAERGDLI